MSDIKLINEDNMKVNFEPESFDLIYSDMIYENPDLSWIDKYWGYLKPNCPMIIQTDWHTEFEVGVYMKTLPSALFHNHIALKAEWGNHPKDRFHQSWDSIIIFTKGKNKKFYSDRIQIPKATAKTKLNPSGRDTKTATAFCDDICLTTTSLERIRNGDKLVRWQKPLKTFDRFVLPFTDEGDIVLDNFMGVASFGEWSYKNNRNYVGIEYDKVIFDLAQERMDKLIGK